MSIISTPGLSCGWRRERRRSGRWKPSAPGPGYALLRRSRCHDSCEHPHFRLGLLEPEAHIHLAVHRGPDGQALLGLGQLTGAAVELAETDVAVRGERAHVQLLGRGQRLPVLGFGLGDPAWAREG